MTGPDARSNEVLNEVFDLFVELEADDWQLDFPVIYTSSRFGNATIDSAQPGTDMKPLFEMVKVEIPAPAGDEEAVLQLQINTLDYDDYVGRVGIGRISNGTISAGQLVSLCKQDEKIEMIKIGKLWAYDGLKRKEIEKAAAGDIVAVAGLGQVNIGETISDPENPLPMPLLTVDEPTLNMTFMVNDSPFAGKEG